MAVVVGNDGQVYQTAASEGQGTQYTWTKDGPVLTYSAPVGNGVTIGDTTPFGGGAQGRPTTATVTIADDPNKKKDDPTKPPSGSDAQAQQNALGVLSNELSTWGFGQDAIDWAWAEITSGKGVDQILFDLRQQPFYQNSIFGQTNTARTKAGLPVMAEAQILAYKDTAMQIARSAGLPQGFMTDSELTQLMGADVSTSELDQRVTNGYVKALQAPAETKQALSDYYGLGPGGLAAYYLDPNKALPLLERQLAASQIGGASIRTGFGEVGSGTAEGLAAQGITEAQAQTGFKDLATLSPLFTPLPGEAGYQGITEGQQLGAEFGGNAESERLIKAAQDSRTAVFQGGGRFGESPKGIEGLGQATPV